MRAYILHTRKNHTLYLLYGFSQYFSYIIIHTMENIGLIRVSNSYNMPSECTSEYILTTENKFHTIQ